MRNCPGALNSAPIWLCKDNFFFFFPGKEPPYLLKHYLWLLSYHNSRVEQLQQKPFGSQSLKYLQLAPLQTQFTTPWLIWTRIYLTKGFPRWLSGKESACNAGDMGSIPGSGRFPRERNANPFQYSCLENPWTEGPHGVQSMRSQKRRMQFNN